MRTFTLLSSLLLASLAACGGASTPDALVNRGVAALNSSDYDGAVASLTEALETLQPGDALYTKAKMKLVEARIHTDAQSAANEFLALAEASPDSVKETDFRTVGSKMTTEKKYSQAIAVVNVGIQTYGETDNLMKMIEAIKTQAEQDGDNEALGELAGLGYL